MTTAILTRPDTSIALTAETYSKAGLNVFQAPCFTIKTNDTVQPQWLQTPAEIWVILSVHGLKHALIIAPELAPTKETSVIAIGPAVEKAWKKHFDHDITSHPLMNSEGVVELLKQAKPSSVKILTTGDGRDVIKSHCMQHCISYAQLNTYQRIPLSIDHQALLELYQKKSNDEVVLTATSSGILKQFMSLLSTELHSTVLSQPLVVGAQRIADLAQELGFINIHLAASPSDEAMCEVTKTLGLKP